jgi:hypothetical protein
LERSQQRPPLLRKLKSSSEKREVQGINTERSPRFLIIMTAPKDVAKEIRRIARKMI